MDISNFEKKQQVINNIENSLKNIKDADVLLEKILSAAREISNADAGSIYEFDSQKDELIIRYSQNDTWSKLHPGQKAPYVAFSMKPTLQSIAGYCVISRKNVNISDVYNLPEYLDEEKLQKRPYNFNPENDRNNNYHTQSMLTLPLLSANGEVLGALQIINSKDASGKIIPFENDIEFYISQFAAKVARIYENAYLIRQNFDRLVKMSYFRDPRETGSHVARVSRFSLEIYDQYAKNHNVPEKIREKFRDNLSLAARSHDVGKVGVPDKILKKPGLLTDEERDIMKGHTCIGAQIFTPIENDLDLMAKNICLHHHDRWDGGCKGYPGDFDYVNYEPETPMPREIAQKLMGDAIPLEARIVALADVYDALRHRRCYKSEWTIDDTFKEIQNESGRQFDPDLVKAFMQIKDRLEDINKAITDN